MTLQQLRYVTTVAETGTMSEAARRLFVSPQNRICRNVLQSGNRVLTDIIAVVRIVLRRFHQ